jgi:hypothetical protein
MKKLLKIWGIALTVVLVGSMFAIAPASVAAAPGAMAWTAQNLPSAAGDVLQGTSEVTDIAVANDGTTVYVVDASVNMNTANSVRKSTNGGNSFAAVASQPAAAGANPPRAIAVAPDDPNVIAVVEAAPGANVVHISTNGGTTWSTLPAFTAGGGGAQATADAMDVAVGPARSGTLLGREYAVALADTTTAVVLDGDVQIIGLTTAWRSAGRTTGIAGTADYMAVEFDPNFVGTRVLVAVGANLGAGTFLHLINDATGSQVLAPTTFEVTGADYVAGGGLVSDILRAEVTLPTDYDPTTGSGRSAYVVTTHGTTTNDDVFRIDNNTFRGLGSAKRAYHSSYHGTIDEGSLFVGDRVGGGTVRFSTNPQVSLPTWTSTKKAPTGANGFFTVRVPANFAETSKVFCGTASAAPLGVGDGDESAFSVSNNAGVSFDQETIIDQASGLNTVNAIHSIRMTPDANTIFMATWDGAQLSLWKSPSPVSAVSWSRVRNFNGTTGLVRVNPEYGDSPVVYVADVSAGGAIHRSGNGGDIFATRASPAGITMADLAVQDANTLYLADVNSTNIYKSTTGAWTWGLPKSSGTGNCISLDVAMADYLLVGKTGAISYSSNGGDSYTRVSTGLGANNYQILADDDFENNMTIYAGGNNAAAGNVMRYVIGESGSFESLGNPANPSGAAVAVFGGVVEMAMQDGTLYVMVAEAGTPAAAVDRNLNPRTATGTVAVTWDTMRVGAPAASVDMAVGMDTSNVLYSCSGAVLSSYGDLFASSKPVITNPGDGATVGIDPVNGRADLVTLTWEAMGSGTGAGNRADIWIREKGTSWAAAATNNNQAVNSAAPNVTMAAVGATWIYAMRANTEYEWRVRFDRAVSGDVVRSQWSNANTIKVQSGTVVQQPHAGPVILTPAGGATTSLTPGISWAPFAGATKYQVILATDSMGKNRIAGTPVFTDAPAFQPTEPLEYDTTYFAFITAVEPTVSPQSVISFTTKEKAVEAPAPAPPVIVKEQPPQPAPVINIPPAPAPVVTQPIIWAIIIIGAVLIIVVIILILRTRRPM